MGRGKGRGGEGKGEGHTRENAASQTLQKLSASGNGQRWTSLRCVAMDPLLRV